MFIRSIFAACVLWFLAAPLALAQCTNALDSTSPAPEGYVWYDHSNGHFCGCTGNQWALLGAPIAPVCVEAESPSAGGRGVTNFASASGGAYAGCYGNQHEDATYTVNAPSAGSYNLRLTAASAETPSSTIWVNGLLIPTIDIGCLGNCGQGAGWTTFGERSGNITLNAGANTIRVAGPSSGGGCFNLDKICVVKNSCDSNQCKAPPSTTANACGYTERGKIGTWNSGGNTLDIQTRQYQRNGQNAWILVSVETNNTKDKHFPRGDNFLGYVTLDGAFNASCLGGGETGWWGLTMPSNITIPESYQQYTEPDGATYFQRPIDCPTN